MNIFAFLTVGALLLTARAASGDLRQLGPEAEHALMRWESALDEISSFDVSFQVAHWSHSPGTATPVRTFSRRHRLLHGMWRVDRLDELEQSGVNGSDEVSAIAWDGEEMRRYRSKQKFGEIMSRSEANESDLGSFRYDQLFANTFFGSRYVDSMRQRPGTTVSRESATAPLILDGPPAPEALVAYNDRRLVVTLDPEANYMPTKIWVSARDLRTPLFEIQNTLAPMAPGIFLPRNAALRMYREGRVLGEQRIEVLEDRSQVNQPIDPDVFSLSFPEGAIVYDGAVGSNFISGEDGRRDYDAFGKWAVNQRRESVLPGSPRGPFGGRLIATAVAVLFLVASFVAIRWLRTAANKAHRRSSD